MDSLKNMAKIFLSSGIAEEEYQLITDDINENNRRTMIVLSFGLSVFFLAMTIMTSFLNGFLGYGIYYAVAALIFGAFIDAVRFGCRGRISTIVVMYAFLFFVMASGICFNRGMFFPLVLAMGPILFVDRPVRVIFAVFVFWGLGFSFAYNTRALGVKETVVLVTCAVIGILSCMYVSVIRCRRLYDEYLTEARGKRDELTGLFNRRAFKEIMSGYHKKKPLNLSLICLDVDGLKITNDSMGHDAGDEMLKGAADCIKEAFGSDGFCCRIGGDEFVVVIDKEKNKVDSLCEKFDEILASWTGVRIKSLHVSYGCVFAADFPDATLEEMTKFADMKLYENKEAFYASKGVDRKKRQQAYNLICDTFDRILMVNLTDNTYETVKRTTVDMDPEINGEGTLSKWFEEFAAAGQVCSEDMEYFKKNTDINFLREHFKTGNMYFGINYKRKCNGVVDDAIMHMLPTKEYSNEKQMLFIYVNIDGK